MSLQNRWAADSPLGAAAAGPAPHGLGTGARLNYVHGAPETGLHTVTSYIRWAIADGCCETAPVQAPTRALPRAASAAAAAAARKRRAGGSAAQGLRRGPVKLVAPPGSVAPRGPPAAQNKTRGACKKRACGHPQPGAGPSTRSGRAARARRGRKLPPSSVIVRRRRAGSCPLVISDLTTSVCRCPFGRSGAPGPPPLTRPTRGTPAAPRAPAARGAAGGRGEPSHAGGPSLGREKLHKLLKPGGCGGAGSDPGVRLM